LENSEDLNKDLGYLPKAYNKLDYIINEFNNENKIV